MHDDIIEGLLWNILTNLSMLTPYRVIFHGPPGNQVQSYLLQVNKFSEIFAISTWVEYRLPIPSISFGSRDEGADAHQVLQVRKWQTVHPPSMDLCTEKI
jgi:hypothetical protein